MGTRVDGAVELTTAELKAMRAERRNASYVLVVFDPDIFVSALITARGWRGMRKADPPAPTGYR